MNSVNLIGRLIRDPEVKERDSLGIKIAKFIIALYDPHSVKEDTYDYVRIVTFGRNAANCEKYLEKGAEVAVIGKLKSDSYEDKDGVTRHTVDVLADDLEFLDFRPKFNQEERSK